MKSLWILRLVGKSKVFLLGAIISLSASAQGLEGLLSGSPFQTSFEFLTLVTGDVQEQHYQLGHQFGPPGSSRAGVFARHQDLANSIPGVPHFSNTSLGLTYQHQLKDERSLSYQFSYGSAGDEPFRDGRDSTIQLNVLYRTSQKWFFVANYSNNRTFLNNVPLPGFIYVHSSSREERLIFGFPFIQIQKPAGDFSFRYQAILPFIHRLRMTYGGWRILSFFVGAEQDSHSYFYSERQSDDKRTFWFERRFYSGIEKSLGPLLKIELQIGRSLDRKFFVGRSFTRSRSDEVKLEDASYLGLNLKSSF